MNDKKHGYGSFICKRENLEYVGEWKNGKKEG